MNRPINIFDGRNGENRQTIGEINFSADDEAVDTIKILIDQHPHKREILEALIRVVEADGVEKKLSYPQDKDRLSSPHRKHQENLDWLYDKGIIEIFFSRLANRKCYRAVKGIGNKIYNLITKNGFNLFDDENK